MFSRYHLALGALFVLCAAPLSGCVADADDGTADELSGTDSAVDAASEERVGEAESALLPGYWSLSTSEERPPISDSSGHLVDAMSCTGSHCDNVALHYGYVGLTTSQTSWTTYFSEEGTSYRQCPANRFVTGIACNHSYCDNLSLQCSSFYGAARTSECYWTPWFSEEARYSYLLDGYFAAGLACSGRFCDNMSIWACRKG